MNKIILNILVLLAILMLGALIYILFDFGKNYLALRTLEMENEAIFQCANSSKYEVKDGEATVSYPVAELYEKCLNEKGIK